MKTNIVLMAGKGQRFADAGYTVSKPLIPVLGKPMIFRAVQSMPPADQWVFVIRQDHADDPALMEALRSTAQKVAILVDPNPVGQLNSCLVAKEYYDNDGSMFVGACDFGMTYDVRKYEALVGPASVDRPDVVAWSFTGQPNLASNPKAWGWLKQDADGWVSGVSVKVPISDDPIHDFAITGSFTFTNGKTFLKIADELMRRGIKVNGEFYIDSMLGLAIEMGYRVRSFPVEYFGWGTPADLKTYEEHYRHENGGN
jgi:dTDP-glucose pyrophosphorylase